MERNNANQSKINFRFTGVTGLIHNGGKLAIGPDCYLYAVIGDIQHTGQLQNINNGSGPDDTSGIFRVNPDNGLPAQNNPFLSNNKSDLMNKYYAYSITNASGWHLILFLVTYGQQRMGQIYMMK